MVHAVIAHHAPAARVLDITHQIPRHDIRAGSLTLWRAAPWVTPGVILAVVDPGVGTERRAVAIETAGAHRAVLVGPDNGLLLPAAHLLGGPAAAVELPPEPCAKGATFAGRDIFAPAAARAADGFALRDLGEPIDPATLCGGPVPDPKVADGEITAEVLWIDHFGNAQLNLDAARAREALGDQAPIRLGLPSQDSAVRMVASYGEIAADEVALVVDSYGLLALSCNRRSAAVHLGLFEGQQVRLCRHGGDRR